MKGWSVGMEGREEVWGEGMECRKGGSLRVGREWDGSREGSGRESREG